MTEALDRFHRSRARCWRIAWLALAVLVGCGSSAPAPTPPPAPASPGRYPVPDPVGSIVNDAAAFAAFAAAVRPDLERDARTSTDPEIQKERWFVIAMLDALDGHLDAAIAALDRVAALETSPAAKAMIGLTLRVLADAGAGGAEAYRRALEARVAALPIADLGPQLSTLRTMAQQFSPEVCQQLVDREVGPHVEHGTVDIDQAHAIVFQRYAVLELVPVATVIDEVLGARGIEPLH
jgi:hypothetical protein